MGKSGKKKQKSGSRPVTDLVLSDENRMLRIILLCVFLLIAFAAFGYGLKSLLDTEPGWETVQCSSSEVNCSSEFVFSYCYGQTEESASSEQKRLENLYAQVATDAWRIFCTELTALNEQPNTTVSVDPALYDALALLQQYENRSIYLGPVYEEYSHIFTAEVDPVAVEYDPVQNAQQAAYIAELVAFTSDPSMVTLRLMGDQKVQLVIAPEYLAFAQQHEITQFVDLGWMTNAFIADYLAQVLTDAGFTNGFLSSYDGFTRNLYDHGEQFSLNLFDRRETSVYLSGTMQYDQPISIVFMRDYPMSQLDKYHYYTFQNGRIVTAYIDPADGMSKSSTDSLVSYSYDSGCAEIMLSITPVFLSDTLDLTALAQLHRNGISSIWTEDTVLHCNDSDLLITLNGEAGVDYTLEYVK